MEEDSEFSVGSVIFWRCGLFSELFVEVLELFTESEVSGEFFKSFCGDFSETFDFFSLLGSPPFTMFGVLVSEAPDTELGVPGSVSESFGVFTLSLSVASATEGCLVPGVEGRLRDSLGDLPPCPKWIKSNPWITNGSEAGIWDSGVVGVSSDKI
jgi:hypothetical protein